MKKVLIITYYFPPSGGPGVQRVLKFARYLPDFGWEPIVLTVRDGDYPARDESLLNEIPSHLRVVRTPIAEPYNLYRLLTGKKAGTAVDVNNIPTGKGKTGAAERAAEWLRSTFFIPDARAGWRLNAPAQAKRLVKELGIDAVYSSSPPYTCALIARSVRRSLGIPWVAGFRDPWTGFLSTPQRWWLPRAIDRRMERSVFGEADRVDVAWKGIAADARRKYPDLPVEKFIHLPNGFDPADFPSHGYTPNPRFTITYTGSMYGVRNPLPVLKAVAALIRRGDVDPGRTRLRFIGRFGAEVLEMFREPTVAPCIEVVPYLAHAESIRQILSSEVLLLVVDEYAGNEEIVPGKVFEYLGARRPILAIAPPGAVADLIVETRAGRVARHTDVDAIASAILEYYRAYLYTRLDFSPDEAKVACYNRREITRRLAALFDSLT